MCFLCFYEQLICFSLEDKLVKDTSVKVCTLSFQIYFYVFLVKKRLNFCQMNTFHILDSHFKFFNTDLWLIDSCDEVRFLHKEYCQSVSLLLINPPVLSVRQSVSVEVTNRYSISLFGNIVLWYYNFLELNALGGQGCILHVKLR